MSLADSANRCRQGQSPFQDEEGKIGGQLVTGGELTRAETAESSQGDPKPALMLATSID